MVGTVPPERRVGELMKAADEVLKAVGDPSRISSSILRNMLELADISQDLEEFLLRAGYLAARHSKKGKGAPAELYKALKEKIKGKDLSYVKELLEFLIMKHEVGLEGLV